MPKIIIRQAETLDFAVIIAEMFEGRVVDDGGTFESKQCLINYINHELI